MHCDGQSVCRALAITFWGVGGTWEKWLFFFFQTHQVPLCTVHSCSISWSWGFARHWKLAAMFLYVISLVSWGKPPWAHACAPRILALGAFSGHMLFNFDLSCIYCVLRYVAFLLIFCFDIICFVVRRLSARFPSVM